MSSNNQTQPQDAAVLQERMASLMTQLSGVMSQMQQLQGAQGGNAPAPAPAQVSGDAEVAGLAAQAAELQAAMQVAQAAHDAQGGTQAAGATAPGQQVDAQGKRSPSPLMDHDQWMSLMLQSVPANANPATQTSTSTTNANVVAAANAAAAAEAELPQSPTQMQGGYGMQQGQGGQRQYPARSKGGRGGGGGGGSKPYFTGRGGAGGLNPAAATFGAGAEQQWWPGHGGGVWGAPQDQGGLPMPYSDWGMTHNGSAVPQQQGMRGGKAGGGQGFRDPSMGVNVSVGAHRTAKAEPESPPRPAVLAPDGKPYAKSYAVVEFKRRRLRKYEAPADVQAGQYVMVDGDRGQDCGLVVHTVRVASDGSYHLHDLEGVQSPPPKLKVESGRVIRAARPDEVETLHTTLANAEQEALNVCRQRCEQLGLGHIDVIDCELQFDRKKISFFFDSAAAVDFRDLVKELYRIFNARIWMENVNAKVKNVVPAGALSAAQKHSLENGGSGAAGNSGNTTLDTSSGAVADASVDSAPARPAPRSGARRGGKRQ